MAGQQQHVAHAEAIQFAQQPCQERPIADRQQRLRQRRGERSQAGAETADEHGALADGGGRHAALNSAPPPAAAMARAARVPNSPAEARRCRGRHAEMLWSGGARKKVTNRLIPAQCARSVRGRLPGSLK
jgi:hypothetical protein